MILTRPLIWLVAPLVLAFILPICHATEHASIVRLWLTLKVCRPLMWRFSEADFDCDAMGDWRGCNKHRDFRMYLIGGKWRVSPENLKACYQKCTNKQSVLCVFCACLHFVRVNVNIRQFYLDTVCGSLIWSWFCRANITPLRTPWSVPDTRDDTGCLWF